MGMINRAFGQKYDSDELKARAYADNTFADAEKTRTLLPYAQRSMDAENANRWADTASKWQDTAAKDTDFSVGLRSHPNYLRQYDDMADSYMGYEGYAEGGAINVAPNTGPDPFTTQMYSQYVKGMKAAGMKPKPYNEAIPAMAQMRSSMMEKLAQQTNAGGSMGMQGYAQGGAIDVSGQQVVGPGTGKSDSIPATVDGSTPSALSNGEFVFPRKAAEYYGTKLLDAMVEKARQSVKRASIA